MVQTASGRLSIMALAPPGLLMITMGWTATVCAVRRPMSGVGRFGSASMAGASALGLASAGTASGICAGGRGGGCSAGAGGTGSGGFTVLVLSHARLLAWRRKPRRRLQCDERDECSGRERGEEEREKSAFPARRADRRHCGVAQPGRLYARR